MRSRNNLPKEEISTIDQIFYEGLERDIKLLIHRAKDPRFVVDQLVDIFKRAGLDSIDNLNSMKNNFKRCINFQRIFVNRNICLACINSYLHLKLNQDSFVPIIKNCKGYKVDLEKIISIFKVQKIIQKTYRRDHEVDLDAEEDHDSLKEELQDEIDFFFEDNDSLREELQDESENFEQMLGYDYNNGRLLRSGTKIRSRTQRNQTISYREIHQLAYTIYSEVNKNFKNFEIFRIFSEQSDVCLIKIYFKYYKGEIGRYLKLNRCQNQEMRDDKKRSSSYSNNMILLAINSKYIQLMTDYLRIDKMKYSGIRKQTSIRRYRRYPEYVQRIYSEEFNQGFQSKNLSTSRSNIMNISEEF